MSTLTPLSWMAASTEPAEMGSAPADQDEIGGHVVVEERLGHAEGVDIDVGVLARDAIEAHEGARELGKVDARIGDHLARGNLAG
jgi:hypothetical protein